MIRSVKSGCGGLLITRAVKLLPFGLGRGNIRNLDKLLELLGPLNTGKVYAGGSYAYYERFSVVGERCCLTDNPVKEPEVNHQSDSDFMHLRILGKTY
ncbi:MAG: hypothetical protein LBG27_14265, partial [Spirochaetaceae bacterium]|nr:hypothetical protein [Spirochaetaceae bacterium]